MAPARSFLSAALFLLILFYSFVSFAQNGNDMNTGVVKVLTTTREGKKRVGTGFIVQMEKDAVYIVTASHVVEGAQQVRIEFFTKRNRPVSAKIIGMEGGDPQGLALLLVDDKIPFGLSALKFNPFMTVSGGDTVVTIGFPRSAGVPWASIKGDIVGSLGKTITFSGAVDEGNSGGPLIKEGAVVGVVTDVTGKFAHAVPAIIAQLTLKAWGVAAIESASAREDKAEVVAPPAGGIMNINSVWRDSHFPSNFSQITQDGNSFYFKRQGVLPNGTKFESVGSGVISGQGFTSHYNAKYQSGVTSEGKCSGTVSMDGMRMEMSCSDSLLGDFPLTAIRE